MFMTGCVLSNYMGLNPSLEGNSFSFSEEIPCTILKFKVQCRVHNSLPVVCIARQPDESSHTLTPCMCFFFFLQFLTEIKYIEFWDVVQHILEDRYEYFRGNKLFYREDGGSTFLINIDTTTRLHDVTSQKTVILILSAVRTHHNSCLWRNETMFRCSMTR
jgi:hypothetical protein